MDLRIFTEPQQGATYEDLLKVAKTAEELDFDAFFRSDHYLHMGSVTGLPGPTDAWITLGALARETTRIRLGTLMTSATFRLPGILAISVAQIDEMSQGRIELGLGAGWYEAEHDAYGVPFPSVAERFERFEEQLEIILGMWNTKPGSSYSFQGKHYKVSESPSLPKPTQLPHPPILIGGKGPVRTPRLAARFANEFNIAFRSLEETEAQFMRVRSSCEAILRDPSSIALSSAQVLCIGENEAEISHRASRIGREVAELRENGLAGGVDEVLEKLEAFRSIGTERMYLQILDLNDLDHLRLVAERILPAVR